MANRVEVFDVTVPAGTAKGSGITPLKFTRVGVVIRMEVIIPDGVNGQAGFRIQNAGQSIIPINAGTYIVGNNERIEWPLEGFVDSGSWGLDGFNNGHYDHTFHLRFLVNEPVAARSALGLANTTLALAVSGLVG